MYRYQAVCAREKGNPITCPDAIWPFTAVQLYFREYRKVVMMGWRADPNKQVVY